MDNLLNILSETYQMTFEKAKANYVLEEDIDVARKNVNSYKKELKEIGIVNLGAIEEYERVSKRYEFLTKQDNDLEEAITTLLKIINELDSVMEKEFIKTFKEIEIEFNNVFKELFKGGSAKLKLTDESNILETGVNIEVSPPGKKITSISLLSGGEKMDFTVFIREESEELFDMMLEQAQIYKDKRVQTATDEKYGEGFSAFLSDAIAKFYE